MSKLDDLPRSPHPIGALPGSPDPDGLREFSVVYTDRALNHMSRRFQDILRDMVARLKRVHGAEAAIVLPGGGTFAMEAVARQFAAGADVLVVRLGWFSYRWSQIVEAGGFVRRETVLKARRIGDGEQAPFAPPPVEEVEAAIARERPGVVFMPHVETASGLLLTDDYIRRVAAAVRAIDGLLVLDGVASGCVWTDIGRLGVDVLVSAPQKVWSGAAGAGFVMLGERAVQRLATTRSNSFAADLQRWHQIMQAYERDGHAYHATLPTDALARTHDAMLAAESFGLERLREAQWALGRDVRALLVERGWPSVAAEGWQAPGVVVSYTRDEEIQSGRAFVPLGLQIAAGVPLQCDEGPHYRSFRLGLFGLDKLADRATSVATLREVLDQVEPLERRHRVAPA